MSRPLSSIIAVTFLFTLAACANPFKAGQMSDASVAAFHKRLDQGHFHELTLVGYNIQSRDLMVK